MKHIFTLILSVLLLTPPAAKSQSWQWGRVGAGAGCDAYAVATDNSGNVFGAGWLFTNVTTDFGSGVTIPPFAEIGRAHV